MLLEPYYSHTVLCEKWKYLTDTWPISFSVFLYSLAARSGLNEHMKHTRTFLVLFISKSYNK